MTSFELSEQLISKIVVHLKQYPMAQVEGLVNEIINEVRAQQIKKETEKAQPKPESKS